MTRPRACREEPSIRPIPCSTLDVTPKHIDVDPTVLVSRKAAISDSSLANNNLRPRRRGREPHDHDTAVRTLAPDADVVRRESK